MSEPGQSRESGEVEDFTGDVLGAAEAAHAGQTGVSEAVAAEAARGETAPGVGAPGVAYDAEGRAVVVGAAPQAPPVQPVAAPVAPAGAPAAPAEAAGVAQPGQADAGFVIRVQQEPGQAPGAPAAVDMRMPTDRPPEQAYAEMARKYTNLQAEFDTGRRDVDHERAINAHLVSAINNYLTSQQGSDRAAGTADPLLADPAEAIKRGVASAEELDLFQQGAVGQLGTQRDLLLKVVQRLGNLEGQVNTQGQSLQTSTHEAQGERALDASLRPFAGSLTWQQQGEVRERVKAFIAQNQVPVHLYNQVPRMMGLAVEKAPITPVMGGSGGGAPVITGALTDAQLASLTSEQQLQYMLRAYGNTLSNTGGGMNPFPG